MSIARLARLENFHPLAADETSPTALAVAIPDDFRPCGTDGEVSKPANLMREIVNVAPMSRMGANIIAHPSAGLAGMMAIIDKAPAMELRRIFKAEATSHRDMLSRTKPRKGRPNSEVSFVHDGFQEFRSFLRIVIPEIGRRPKGKTLDRKNNTDRTYKPGNIRWSTAAEQNRNRSTTIMVEKARGGAVPFIKKAERHGIKADTARHRKRRGWSDEAAVSLTKHTRRPKATVAPVEATAAPTRTQNNDTAPLWTAWSTAWARTFPLAPRPLPWTSKQRGQVRTLAARVRLGGVEPEVFLTFAVESWREVTLRRMRQEKERPEFPEIGYLSMHWRLDAFWSAMGDVTERKKIAAIPDGPNYERWLAELSATGVPTFEAARQIERYRIHLAALAKLEEGRLHLATTMRALEAEKRALARQRLSQPMMPAPPRGQFRLVERTPIDWSVQPEDVDLDALYAGIGPWVDEP